MRGLHGQTWLFIADKVTVWEPLQIYINITVYFLQDSDHKNQFKKTDFWTAFITYYKQMYILCRECEWWCGIMGVGRLLFWTSGWMFTGQSQKRETTLWAYDDMFVAWYIKINHMDLLNNGKSTYIMQQYRKASHHWTLQCNFLCLHIHKNTWLCDGSFSLNHKYLNYDTYNWVT